VSGCCCQQTGMPGHCGGCGQGCGCAYRVGSGLWALSSPGAAFGAPTWQSSPLVLTLFMGTKTFPATIFHPPHFNQS
jgi:hypothetical protein